MRKYFATGLIILLPIAITIAVLVFFINILTEPFVGTLEKIINNLLGQEIQNLENHHTLLLFFSKLLSLIFLFFLTITLGYLGRKLFFSWFLKKINILFTKIPVVKSIYSATRDISKIFLKNDKRFFKKSVLVPFPHNKSLALGLSTGIVPQAIQKELDYKLEAVFIPTSPHPISGFLTLLNQKDVKEIDLSTEELFKIVISCGMYDPSELRKDDTRE